jgi:triacylglycerol lipase
LIAIRQTGVTRAKKPPNWLKRFPAMAGGNGLGLGKRCHVVLVPGFGGFDALGQVEYYSGVTPLFRHWKRQNPLPVVLHYFDNLPTAAVTTRATRLRMYLAKRIARGEILDNDCIVLVGHSTGGLDIRQLVWDLHKLRGDRFCVDGQVGVAAQTVRKCLDGVVFLSVPHRGTNIADWVYSHAVLRQLLIADLRIAVAGSDVYLLDEIESRIAGAAASLTDAELLLAVKDALTEANEHYGKPGPLRTAQAQEASSELALYIRHMASDFRVIDDLTSQPHDLDKKSPAHFDEEERKEELDLWNDPPIRVLSYATVGGRPFRFPSGCQAPVWDLTNPCTYPEIAKDCGLSAGTDFIYRLCYRACAGGPLRCPEQSERATRILGQAPPEPIEQWDNDGIVNTVSMFWPTGETVLVQADHLDIVGHFELVKAEPDERVEAGRETARVYQSYDSFRSVPRFTHKTFRDVWTEIFDFAINAKASGRRKGRYTRPVKMAAASP